MEVQHGPLAAVQSMTNPSTGSLKVPTVLSGRAGGLRRSRLSSRAMPADAQRGPQVASQRSDAAAGHPAPNTTRSTAGPVRAPERSNGGAHRSTAVDTGSRHVECRMDPEVSDGEGQTCRSETLKLQPVRQREPGCGITSKARIASIPTNASWASKASHGSGDTLSG